LVQTETSANSPLQLLVVEDSEDDFEILLRELRKGGYFVFAERVKLPSELDDALGRPCWFRAASAAVLLSPSRGGFRVDARVGAACSCPGRKNDQGYGVVVTTHIPVA